MKISLIIPTLNAGRELGGLLAALRRQSLPPDEIIVVGDHGILERGTHEQLVAQGGIYADLAAGARLAGA